jgi:hypothetical protein
MPGRRSQAERALPNRLTDPRGTSFASAPRSVPAALMLRTDIRGEIPRSSRTSLWHVLARAREAPVPRPQMGPPQDGFELCIDCVLGPHQRIRWRVSVLPEAICRGDVPDASLKKQERGPPGRMSASRARANVGSLPEAPVRLVDVAPRPRISLHGGAHHGMPRLVEVLCRVLARRGVAAADMAARLALP